MESYCRLSRRLVASFLLTIGISYGALAQAEYASETTIDPAAVHGSWNFTIDVPGQPVNGELRLALVGSELQGRVLTEDGQSYRFRDVDLDGSTFSFEVLTPEYGRVRARAIVAGAAFTGTVSLPDYGSYSWTGAKEKEELSTRSPIRLILADEAARSVVDRHMPDFLSHPDIQQAAAYSIRDIAAYLGTIPEDVLDAIDADLQDL